MTTRLEDIGFYTLSDERAASASEFQPLARCELILTDRCNFSCPYCRGPKHKRPLDMSTTDAMGALNAWQRHDLQAVRFSGGEPMLHPSIQDLVIQATIGGADHVAISTNGSFPLCRYRELIDLGVNDFSISLDACTPEGVTEMSGGRSVWDTLINNITEISKQVYVTVGMVFNEQNVSHARESVLFAAGLGVSDIRVLSSAQFGQAIDSLKDLPDEMLAKFPILNYRVRNFRAGRNVRGLGPSDSGRCRLVLDDMAVAGGEHFPCIIYMREGGDPIGEVGDNMREDRASWCRSHDSRTDPICSRNCLDVCIDYNNKAEAFARPLRLNHNPPLAQAHQNRGEPRRAG